MRSIKYGKLFLFVVIIFMLTIAIPLGNLNFLSTENLTLSNQELNEITNSSFFNVKVDNNLNDSINIQYSILNIPVKTVNAKIEDREVYLGGIPVGIDICSKGVIVTGKSDIVTTDGIKSPLRFAPINIGDVLLEIDGKQVRNSSDISKIINSTNKNYVELTLENQNNKYNIRTHLLTDTIRKQKRLGLMVKNSVSGIGTLTFVNPNNKRFGALGHQIIDGETGMIDKLSDGNIYQSSIIGYNPGRAGRAGNLNGVINPNKKLGSIDKNTNFGLYGTAYTDIIRGLPKVKVASRNTVKVGGAKIFTTIHGGKPELYDIEIIKASKQNSPSEKGIVLRVTDERLLKRTGGILQGMSGSPIIQNGNLIGAVTHVFINDPVKGFGIYADFMVNN